MRATARCSAKLIIELKETDSLSMDRVIDFYLYDNTHINIYSQKYVLQKCWATILYV